MIQFKKISDILDEVLTKFKISMSEVAVQNFIIDIFVSLKEFIKEYYCKQQKK